MYRWVQRFTLLVINVLVSSRNAAMESTWATVKRDVLSIHGDWKHITRSELRTILFDYIETFYNRQRHQAGLQHHTPAEVYAASAVA